MKLIINTDNLGYSAKKNAAIFSYLDRGLITSATVMANATSFEAAVPEIKAWQGNKDGGNVLRGAS